MGKHILALLCFLWLLTLSAFPREVKFPVSSIDTSLVKNAGMVIRLHETVLELRSLNSEVIKIHHVVTIFKGSAAENAIFRAFYDTYSSVDVFRGSMYDAAGNLVRHFNSKDIRDVSAIEDFILYSDDRVKVIRPVLGFYPVTLEFFSEVTVKKILLYPSFEPQDDYKQAVEYSSLEIIADEETFPRFKEVRLPVNTVVTGDGRTGKKWEFRALKALTEEPLSPSLEELTPVIYLHPAAFNIKGYPGDFSTWKSLGQWIMSLNAGRDSLPPAMAQKARSLVQGIDDPEEKTRTIYRYMQQTTRYVAVKLGIGGVQPEKAMTVASMGYGDCKGLVNYTSALLKCVGIPSWQVRVKAGKDAGAVQTDFPGYQFNHVILCVPVAHDTTWLECTNQRCPYGWLGSFTDDRDALLLGPEGGQIVHTPAYGRKVNTMVRKTTITIDSTGSADITLSACYRGLLYEDMQELLFLSPEKQKEELADLYSIPGLRVQSFQCSSEAEKIPSFSETLVMNISNYASVNGNRIFIPPGALVNKSRDFLKDDSRSTDLVLYNSYSLTDSIYIDLPKGYRIESKPISCELKSDFGNLRTELQEAGSKFIFIRHFNRESGRFPASSFNDFVEFTKQVLKQDNKKLVIVKN